MSPRHARGRALAGLGGLALAFVVVRNAWLADDAFITLRTVEAALRGDGLVWNPATRVQAYTHPLWMGVLVVARAAIRDAYQAAIAAGFVVSAAAAWALVRHAREPARGGVLLLAAALSKPFVHFATSGLENPLAALLVIGLSGAGARAPAPRALRWTGLLAGLAILTRPDLALLAAPPVLVAAGRARGLGARRILAALAPGAAAVLAWGAFALVYYGAPLPNTAYAKLGAGLPRDERLVQGLHYLRDGAAFDPWTAAVIVAGVGVGLGAARRRPAQGALALGTVAYLGWVLWMGGDFMHGRFFSVPFVAALAILARVPLPRPRRWGAAAALGLAGLGLGLLAPPRTTFEHPDFGATPWGEHGIIDEQAYYFRGTGLFAPPTPAKATVPGAPDRPPPPRQAAVHRARRLDRGEVSISPTVGVYGWAARDRAVILDPIGLTDPLLSRVPAMRNQAWRPGHPRRAVPRGYVETLRDGVCRIPDEDVCAHWAALDRITRGPLWSRARLEAIWELNTGQLDALLDAEAFRRPTLRRYAEARAREGLRFEDSGVTVVFDERAPGAVHVRLEAAVDYRARFHDGEREVCVRPIPLEGVLAWEADAAIRCDRPFDRVLIEPTSRPRRRVIYQLLTIRRAGAPRRGESPPGAGSRSGAARP
ncbi:MAG TPA: hypothetical protein RMH99_25920 [Sandaracinaceae bacterium LLY-WYZ-13_1]|nr:hypothetical protein [Sandaracinaceae bacterium LLY-WYZ-13_1]